MLLPLFFCLILYIVGFYYVYNKTNTQMNKLKIHPNSQEIGILFKLIILYPIFYPEIEVLLKTCTLEKDL